MSKIEVPSEYTLTENHSTNSYILKAPISGNTSLTMKLLSEMADAARTDMIRNFNKYHRFSLSLQSPNTTGRNKLLVLNDNPDKKTEMVHQFRHLISLTLLWNSDPSVMKNTRQNTMNTVYDLSLARTYHDWSVTPRTCRGTHPGMADCMLRQNKATVISDNIEEPVWESTFLHVIPNGVVDRKGYVDTETVRFVPLLCKSSRMAGLRRIRKPSTFVDEVFVISQNMGGGFYHISNTVLPRLVPYLNFLKKHEHIKLHVNMHSPKRAYSKPAYIRYLTQLGLHPDRMVEGLIAARVVYLPKGGTCWHTVQPNGQVLSHVLRNSVRKLFPQETVLQSRNLVFIKRLDNRRLNQSDEIKPILHNLAEHYKLDFKMYSGSESERDTWLMFYNAVMIVAPHGAGLSNMLLSRPGVYVVEVLCADDINLCYSDLAFGQGNYYRGIGATRGCERGMTVNVTQVIEAVQAFLEQDAKINSAQRLAS